MKKRWLVITLAAALLTFAFAWDRLTASSFAKPSGPEPLLLERATLITNVGNWVEVQLAVGDYLWWSPTQVLAFSGENEETLIEIKTKARTHAHAPALRPHQWQLSPDRKMVIHEKWEGRKLTWTITDPTGVKQFGSWSIASRTPQSMPDADAGYADPEAKWSEDGKSIYQIECWPQGSSLCFQVTERPTARPEIGHAYPVAVTTDRATTLDVHDGKALMIPYQRQDPKEFTLKEWNLDSRAKSLREWKIAAPKGHVIIDYTPSPDFRKALWLMGQPGAKILDATNAYPYRSISLWTSDLHGENMKEIGAIPFQTEDDMKQMDHFQHFGGLLWNPDCAHVSFIYYRKLYIVPA
ncbi:MAG: hypothetical protein ACHQ50_02105 [Fimbriimonadales bacterium]